VPEVRLAVGAPGAGHGVVAAVGALPHPQVGGVRLEHLAVADELEALLLGEALVRTDRPARDRAAARRDDRVEAGGLGDEPPVLLDLPGRTVAERVVRSGVE